MNLEYPSSFEKVAENGCLLYHPNCVLGVRGCWPACLRIQPPDPNDRICF